MLPTSFLTNCFQENWVAASKVSGAPSFRARIRASRPNQVICPSWDKVKLSRDKDSCRKTWWPCGKNWQILGGKFGRLAPQNSGQVFQTFGPAARLHQSIAVRTNQPKWCNAFLLKIGKTVELRSIITPKFEYLSDKILCNFWVHLMCQQKIKNSHKNTDYFLCSLKSCQEKPDEFRTIRFKHIFTDNWSRTMRRSECSPTACATCVIAGERSKKCVEVSDDIILHLTMKAGVGSSN